MAQFIPVTKDRLVVEIVERIRLRASRIVVAVDGADAAQPLQLAEPIRAAVRELGRACDTISLHDWVHPASLRFEHGRTDEMAYRTNWFDYAALQREVLDALHERAEWLPALWDERADRSARATIRPAHDGHVLIVAGPMLLGRRLEFDLTVRLDMSEAALLRASPAEEQWTVPALRSHDRENPSVPDVFVRWDHPDRPAIRAE